MLRYTIVTYLTTLMQSVITWLSAPIAVVYLILLTNFSIRGSLASYYQSKNYSSRPSYDRASRSNSPSFIREDQKILGCHHSPVEGNMTVTDWHTSKKANKQAPRFWSLDPWWSLMSKMLPPAVLDILCVMRSSLARYWNLLLSFTTGHPAGLACYLGIVSSSFSHGDARIIAAATSCSETVVTGGLSYPYDCYPS